VLLSIYRPAGLKIEAEALVDVAATGSNSKWVLDMIRAPSVLDYPKDERPASFEGP
jgi:hypothetical protein